VRWSPPQVVAEHLAALDPLNRRRLQSPGPGDAARRADPRRTPP
jgi:hypothetical protein